MNTDQLLHPGAIGVLATDTVYGVVARAADRIAVERLYQLKHREHKPGTIIAASVSQLQELGIKRRYLTAVEQFWPGPLSVVLPSTDPQLAYLTQGTGSLAVRIPDDVAIQNLLRSVGPLLTSSANHPGEPTANTIAEAQSYFGDQVDFYWDSGDRSGRPASTIIRIVDDAIEVLRPGAAAIDERLLQ